MSDEVFSLMILVTGGCGYIGSHAVTQLLDSGYDVVVIDNLSNSCITSITRIRELTGKNVNFIQGDVRDYETLSSIFVANNITAVMHFAGLKSVSESKVYPTRYFDNNVSGLITLVGVMAEHQIFNLVFSSSATVYGDVESVPIKEDFPISQVKNAYGRSKLIAETILTDIAASESKWSIAILRYFNPMGAHTSGSIGEDPSDIPANLLPFITQVAVGRLKELNIFGSDYDTHDGTGVRDYIHVVDLIEGHIKALNVLEKFSGVRIWNLGSGIGYSVLEIVTAFERISSIRIPYKLCPRRDGDVSTCWANIDKAKAELDWLPSKTLDDMLLDSWRWQKNNPDGYE